MAQFINCRRACKIRGEIDTATKERMEYSIPKDYIGTVPEWVSKHWYFQALCKDATITTIVDTASNKVDEALNNKDNEEVARLKAEKASELDAAKEQAKEAANKEADEKGLDEAGRKKLVAKLQRDAVKLVELKYADK